MGEPTRPFEPVAGIRYARSEADEVGQGGRVPRPDAQPARSRATEALGPDVVRHDRKAQVPGPPRRAPRDAQATREDPHDPLRVRAAHRALLIGELKSAAQDAGREA